MSDAVLYEAQDGVATVTINRPDAMNACDAAVRVGLREAFERAADDSSARAVVLTGAGSRAFCVGQDLKELEPLYASGDPSLSVLVDEYNAAATAVVACPKPVIAALNGAAAGAGMSLALAADFRIASDAVKFTPAFGKIALVPDTGGSWFLTRLVGVAKATEILILGEPIPAAEALRLGIVTRVVSAESVLAEAMGLATSLAAGPTLAFGWTKELVHLGATATLQESLKRERELQNTAGQTADHLGAVAAFLAKQPPTFHGR